MRFNRRSIFRLASWPVLLVFVLAACAPKAVAAPPKLVAFPGTPTAQCAQEEIQPKIEQIQPSDVHPGSDVKVTGSGGYLRDTCGGYDESARMYQVFIDDEPVAPLSCYINHCESSFKLPPQITAGTHCMGVAKGACQTKLDVTEN